MKQVRASVGGDTAFEEMVVETAAALPEDVNMDAAESVCWRGTRAAAADDGVDDAPKGGKPPTVPSRCWLVSSMQKGF